MMYQITCNIGIGKLDKGFLVWIGRDCGYPTMYQFHAFLSTPSDPDDRADGRVARRLRIDSDMCPPTASPPGSKPSRQNTPIKASLLSFSSSWSLSLSNSLATNLALRRVLSFGCLLASPTHMRDGALIYSGPNVIPAKYCDTNKSTDLDRVWSLQVH